MKKYLPLLCIVILFYGCPKKVPTAPYPTPQKNPPTISTFTATPDEIFKGNNSTLSWNVANATSVSINQGIGTVGNSGTQTVSPASTTSYTITASNTDGTVNKSCVITVNLNLPKIEAFKLTPDLINYGSSSELYWYVTNATNVVINQGIGNVGQNTDPIQGTNTVSPTTTTTYNLTATNNDGNVTATCTLTVLDAANVIMTNGPIFKDRTSIFEYIGIVKNVGNIEASFVKIYIYLYDSSGMLLALLDYEYTYADEYTLSPGQSSPWDVLFSDSNHATRNAMDHSKTKFELTWSEY